MYINQYHVSQRYGGPEEGGWWYSAGECLQSINVTDWPQKLIDSVLEQFRVDDKAMNANLPPFHSVNSEGNYRSEIEEEPGVSFPEQRPHYE
jgi:hypothetical protein